MQINRINILGDSFLTKPMPLRSSNDEGVRHEDERLSISPVPNAQRRFKFEAYGLLTTTFGAGLETCSWALTFWICAACSLSCAIKTSIPFCCRATVDFNSEMLACCFSTFLFQGGTGESKRRSPRTANAFPVTSLGVRHTRPSYLATLRFIDDYLRRGFVHLNLRAHFLDLRGLLFQLRNHGLHFAF